MGSSYPSQPAAAKVGVYADLSCDAARKDQTRRAPPNWSVVRIVRRPTVDHFALYFPRDAAIDHVTGHARMACIVTTTGGLKSCRITGEDPPDRGFGVATLWLARDFKVAMGDACGGAKAGDEVEIPVEWNWKSAAPTTDFEEDQFRRQVRGLQR